MLRCERRCGPVSPGAGGPSVLSFPGAGPSFPMLVPPAGPAQLRPGSGPAAPSHTRLGRHNNKKNHHLIKPFFFFFFLMDFQQFLSASRCGFLKFFPLMGPRTRENIQVSLVPESSLVISRWNYLVALSVFCYNLSTEAAAE